MGLVLNLAVELAKRFDGPVQVTGIRCKDGGRLEVRGHINSLGMDSATILAHLRRNGTKIAATAAFYNLESWWADTDGVLHLDLPTSHFGTQHLLRVVFLDGENVLWSEDLKP